LGTDPTGRSPLKILLAHNAYQQRGGEDAVVEAEAALLRSRGHEVLEYRRHNDELAAMGRAQAALGTLWSTRTRAELRALLRAERPDVLHVHNTFPLISPSLYWAAADCGVPVVQTLHNFRLLCPQAMLLREGRVCESCVGRLPLAGVVHGCYRGSRAQTGVLAGMLVLHRALGTWVQKVHRYIALNEFCRAKFIEGGLPAERIAVKANFVDMPPPPPAGARAGLLYVGRLAPEKGIDVLVRAAGGLPAGSLRVAGSGPEQALLAGPAAVHALGALAGAQVVSEMQRAVALVFPSIWFETFGLVVIEAFACGTPVIASRIGGVPDLVEDGVTGLLVTPGDAADLALKMQWALDHPERMAAMGRAARGVYEARYTADINHGQLLAIYRDAIAEQARGTAS